MTYEFIAGHSREYSVRRMCRVLGVPPSSYYAWRQRPTCVRQQADQELVDQIRNAQVESRGSYGSPRVHQWLRQRGVRCGRHRVARLMRLNGRCLPKSCIPRSVENLRPAAPRRRVWLVGGAIRDQLLERPCYDFDFVVDGDAIALGRRLANEAGADYFELDPERGTGRMLLSTGDGRRQLFDFSRLRGASIEDDLRARDLTVNAMGAALESPGQLIDPTGGLADLRHRVVRACSPRALLEDPVRALRCIRIASELSATVEHETVQQARAAAARLSEVSPERLRDEFFRILGLPGPTAALRQLDALGLLSVVLPEVEPLRGLPQPSAHAFDALTHTMAVVAGLERVLWILEPGGSERGTDLAAGWLLQRLGPYRATLDEFLDFSLSFGRTRRQLLYFAALVHDVGKARTYARGPDGVVRFLGHEAVGAAMAVDLGRRMALSLVEIAELERLVADHMRPGWLEKDAGLTPRAVYRYFRSTQAAGVGIGLLSLADLLGKHVPPVPEEAWSRRVRDRPHAVTNLVRRAIGAGRPSAASEWRRRYGVGGRAFGTGGRSTAGGSSGGSSRRGGPDRGGGEGPCARGFQVHEVRERGRCDRFAHRVVGPKHAVSHRRAAGLRGTNGASPLRVLRPAPQWHGEAR